MDKIILKRIRTISFLIPATVYIIAFTGCFTSENKSSNTNQTADAASSLFTSKSQIPAGSICANGGIQIDMGFDNNGNNSLDSDEVTKTEYVCNGENGADGTNGINGSDATDIKFPDGYSNEIKNITIDNTTGFTVPSNKTLYILTAFSTTTNSNNLQIDSKNYWFFFQYSDPVNGTFNDSTSFSYTSPLTVKGGSKLTCYLNDAHAINITGYLK